MKAITNQLIVSFDYKKIDSTYDFYAITTSGKYIPYGAKCLDNKEGKVRFESIAFESGKSLYSMTKKGVVSRFDLVNELGDDNLIIEKVDSTEIPEYMHFRLFLFSLNNFTAETLSFNNLTGNFYVLHPEWIKRNGLSFTAIRINIEKGMTVSLEAVNFAKCSLFRDKKKIKDYPRYAFANKNNALKRVFDANDDTYIKKGLYNKKAEIPFLALNKNEIKGTKTYFLYHVFDLLTQRYGDLLSFDYKSIRIAQTIGVEKDKNFMQYALDEARKLKFNFVNLVSGAEYEDEFADLVDKFENVARIEGKISNSIEEDCANIVLIHNSDFYEQQQQNDPHSQLNSRAVSQCIAVEDSASKIIADNEAIINTIIKEVVIKNDIIKTKKISLDKWGSYGFDVDWIFGKEHEGRHYFMIVHPDGRFDLCNKPDNLSAWDIDILNECSDCLTDNKGKDVTVIATCDGSINVLTKTNRYPLPAKEIFELDFISRSKDSRDKYLAGVVDINFYEEDAESYCSVGIKGSGMNTKIIRAPHLYKVDVISGNNVIGKILSSMSVTFVKYKSFTVLPYPVKYLNEYIALSTC